MCVAAVPTCELLGVGDDTLLGLIYTAVLVAGIADSVVQSTLYSFVACLSHKHGAFAACLPACDDEQPQTTIWRTVGHTMFGNGIAGVSVSLLRLATKGALSNSTADLRRSTTVYFMIAVLVSTCCARVRLDTACMPRCVRRVSWRGKSWNDSSRFGD